MAYVIHPLKGMNDLEFGMTIEEARSRMTGTFEVVDYHDGHHPADMYYDQGVFLRYDDYGHLAQCEFFAPAEAILAGVDVMALTIAQAKALLLRLDPHTLVKKYDATSFDLAIGLGTEDPDELGDDAALQSICIGREGTYDEFRPGQPEEDIWDMAEKNPDMMAILVKYLGERPKSERDGGS